MVKKNEEGKEICLGSNNQKWVLKGIPCNKYVVTFEFKSEV